jgi:ubiquinone/menaquinone biosynthesis C-methylase UbiE
MPPYQILLDTYHAAWEKELERMLHRLPIEARAKGLDVGCGTGFFTRMLARRLSPEGLIIGVDTSHGLLKEAERHSHPFSLPIQWKHGRIERLPFHNNAFDFSWCAQSLFSFPDPVKAVKEMARVVKPGGWIAVLENDTLHEIILPWPPEVELAFRTAELQAFKDEAKKAGKFYVARNLRTVFWEAGISDSRQRTFISDRHAPLGPDTADYINAYLANLRQRVWRRLNPAQRRKYGGWLDPGSERYPLSNPAFTMARIDRVLVGRKD